MRKHYCNPRQEGGSVTCLTICPETTPARRSSLRAEILLRNQSAKATDKCEGGNLTPKRKWRKGEGELH